MSMRKSILFIILLFTITSAMSQNFDRVEVKGRILVDANDVEGVTVYNTSSNKGTITDENGEFKITVAINDFIEFSALQFEDFSLTIDDDILKSKTLTVFLIERINKLNEVVILPFGLSGNLPEDLERVKTYNPDLDAIYFGVFDITAYEFSNDYKSEVVNTEMRKGEFYNGVNFVKLLGINSLFASKKGKDQKIANVNASNIDKLRQKYTTNYLSQNFNIPVHQVRDFIVFVEPKVQDKKMLEEGNEMYLIEFLSSQSALFLKEHIEKK